MLGDRYFASRDHLIEVAGSIHAMARENGVKIPDHDLPPNIAAPFMLVAFGEVNAGKSSLINALMGVELCPSGRLPTTHDLRYYLHGREEENQQRSQNLTLCHRPNAQLKRFEFLDTPGTNSAAFQAAKEELLPAFSSAELIVAVFTAENPWIAATWEIIDQLTVEELERTILVVQRTDLKQPEDIPIILGHMRDLCMKRTGKILPIFPVSALLALQAKTSTTGAAESWSASRFSSLEHYISEKICRSQTRAEVLREAWHQAARTLRRIEDHLDVQRRNLDDDAWFLSSLEREIESLRDRILAESPLSLEVAVKEFRAEADHLVKSLQSRLSLVRSVWHAFCGDQTANAMEAQFANDMLQAGLGFADKEGARLIQICEDHWASLRPKVHGRMGFDPGISSISGEMKAPTLAEFRARMEKAIPRAVSTLHVRSLLSPLLRQRLESLRSFIAMSLMACIAAGILGNLGHQRSAGIVLILAGLILAAGASISLAARRQITHEYHERLIDAAGDFAESMRKDHTDAIRAIFKDYSSGLIGVRRQLADQKASLQPKTNHLGQLFLNLKAVELEL